MSMFSKGLAAATMMAVTMLATSYGSANEPAVGDDAPDFTLPGSDGNSYHLADYKDKQVVVVAWFPKAFTGGWTRQCKALRAQGDVIRQYNVAYFAASCDKPEDNAKFAQSLELDYPILSDESTETAAKYGLVSGGGKFPARWTIFIGKDGKILHVEKNINVDDHGKQVAEILEKLGVEKK